ncbi:MAG TPA: 4-alpha-glucanotransferase [Clostridia bacterium]|nr:4-alpha-glucanotransferase [Clostridia bacterium]
MKRSSAVLLHVSSLPSPYGIGTFGKAAYDFVDLLALGKQSYWQMLPLSPTGYGDSPYQSYSGFALNPYFIDLDTLVDEGLLEAHETSLDWGDDPSSVDFGKIYQNRFVVLRKAFNRFDRDLMNEFCKENSSWLYKHALYCAIKDSFGGKPWYEWSDELKFRSDEAVRRVAAELTDETAFHCFVQYKADEQFTMLRTYAQSKGIEFIGDIPIYLPLDSADVWFSPELFDLDDDLYPNEVAGVPPDGLSECGQLWGNPLYRWDKHRDDGYSWWCERLRVTGRRFSLVRIDHFRGLESYWCIPVGSTSAKNGYWRKGPDIELIEAFKRSCPDVHIIAEDLGYLTPAVKNLLSASGYAGMRVMEFGFDPDNDSRELPHNYPVHCVAYASTHDCEPMMKWIDNAPSRSVAMAVDYLGLSEREGLNFGFIRGLMTSSSELVIVQFQDLIGSKTQMNSPQSLGCWTYRALPCDMDSAIFIRLAHYTQICARAPQRVQKKRK